MNITYKTIVSTAVLFLLFTSSVSMADAMDKPAMDMPAMDDSMAMMMKLEPMMVNINTATSEEMSEALKGVGPMIAGAIIKHREANGPFASAEDIMMVKGVGDVTFQANKEAIVVE
ncbi:MAG: ComEA family DNA-binding protein [Pseudomonadales bacterium]|jgi:competence ComEA-like helix-hairpin-helix protein|nr:helix-hairpin-helix domain-containing protein [Porticoccaceae bacterium]|tara:strand:- start:310 stop:657 length:348 start_codon:yes stop_codon:yes gene_type:complete